MKKLLLFVLLASVGLAGCATNPVTGNKELRSEAELAAVLGHEIVHAAAKHGAKGMQRAMLLQGAVAIATIAVATQNADYANLAQVGASVGAQLINQKYGRDAELESDK